MHQREFRGSYQVDYSWSHNIFKAQADKYLTRKVWRLLPVDGDEKSVIQASHYLNNWGSKTEGLNGLIFPIHIIIQNIDNMLLLGNEYDRGLGGR